MSKKINSDLKKGIDMLNQLDVPAIKIGLDIGASSVKVSYFNDGIIEDFSFPNRVDVDVDNGDGITIEVDGEAVKVASVSGVSNATKKKVNYKYMKHIILNVAYQLKNKLEIDGDIKLDITTCLPPEQYKDSRNDYKELLLNCTSRGTVENETFNTSIENVRCGAEGIILLKSFNINTIAKNLLKIMLIDVGSSTADIILLEKVGEDKWKIKAAHTSDYAGASMCKEISSYLNSTTKANYEWDNLEMLGKYQLNQEVISIDANANDVDRTVKSLLSDISKIGSFAEYMPLLSGQGSKILSENELFKKTTKFLIVDEVNQKYGNSRGCLKA